MEIDEAYKGREHSWVKHKLLEGYLEKLLLIKGLSGTKELVYVDCFAGPWGDESETLSGTSIAISLEILVRVRDTLEKVHKITGTNFKAIYIEEAKKRHKRLSEYLGKNCPSGVTCHALHGDYSDLQDEILHLCGSRGFAFFFVDPKGWTDVGIPRFGKLLQRPKSEFLITFMYDFLNRFIGKAELRKQVSEMLGDLSEQNHELISSLSPKDREEWVVRKYREELKAAMGPESGLRPRSYHAEVLHKEKARTLYHLVYVTRHPKGIVKFAETSEKVDFLQRVVRIRKREDVTGQIGLFTPEEEAAQHDDTKIDLEAVRSYWLRQLSDTPLTYNDARLADMLEETGWLIGDFEDAFQELLAEKKVENLDTDRKRPVHPINFEKGERLRRCV